MSVTNSATNPNDRPGASPRTNPEDEARTDLEYHSLMNVRGGDEPAHIRSFVRGVESPVVRPSSRRRRVHQGPDGMM